MPDVAIQVGQLDPASDAADLELDHAVAAGSPVYFDVADDASKTHPIAARILELPEISAVLLQGKKITLCRSNDAPEWGPVVESVKRVVTDYFANLPEAPKARKRTEKENALMLSVQNVLNQEINPMVASHGGFIEVADVKEKVVYLNLSGGCQGCGMAAVTLKQGVEKVLYERLPEIEQILDSTDHASGVNPYYSS